MKLLILAAFLCVSASARTIHQFQTDVEEEAKSFGGESPTIWAVLVAGSKGWSNYRHQADVSHAYQILKKNGVPESNIITMMYDDIANSRSNPTRGVIINEPNGHDVYEGVVIDYKGSDVTPKNFLKVLVGNATNAGSGKTLQSGPNDHVFVNFVDHGAPGLLAFPNEELHADQLQKAFDEMHAKRRFGKLVMYTEACEAGSMFKSHLPEDYNIFVTTASNPSESSYACYYDSKRRTYLGDLYSVQWMLDSETEDLSKETLAEQYEAVKEATSQSHVMEYGDLQISQMKVSDFQGHGGKTEKRVSTRVPAELDAVPSWDVPLEILKHILSEAATVTEQRDIMQQIHLLENKRQMLVRTLEQIVVKATGDSAKTESIMTDKMNLSEFGCYRELVNTFSQRCFNLSENEYAFRQLYVLVNLCQLSIPKENVIRAMESECPANRNIVGIF